MAVVRENASELKELWRRRIRQAQDAQKPYWGTWATNLAFAAGQHWLVWDEKMSQLRSIKEFDDRYRSREMFTADRITERRQAQIGELSAEDDRPQLLAAQPGEDAEDVTDVLNDLCAYAWDREWDAADVLLRARGMVLDVGYCAIRCRWNPDEGPVAGRVPIGQDGQAVDPNQLAENGMLPDGSLPKFKTVHEGRTEWELYSPFQSLTPPGIVHEKQFPWEALVKPVTIEEVKAVYGVDLDEDTDIVSTIGIPAAVKAGSGQRSNNRLRDHAWLYLCYDRPSRSAPQGRELVFGGPNLELLDVKEGLPYTLDKKPHSGVTYLHWWRLSDRFQSKSFIEGQKDPQRIINRRKTQNVEIIDRSMPKLIVGKGDWPEETTGAPMELIELNPGTRQPIALEGQGPGQWMYQDIESLDEDLVHASTLSNLRLGENPGSVDTYGQLAILNDNEQGKRQAIVGEHRRTIGELVRLSLNDARRYWPPEKIGEVEGDDDQIKQVTFKRDQIPPTSVSRRRQGSRCRARRAPKSRRSTRFGRRWSSPVSLPPILSPRRTGTRIRSRPVRRSTCRRRPRRRRSSSPAWRTSSCGRGSRSRRATTTTSPFTFRSTVRSRIRLVPQKTSSSTSCSSSTFRSTVPWRCRQQQQRRHKCRPPRSPPPSRRSHLRVRATLLHPPEPERTTNMAVTATPDRKRSRFSGSEKIVRGIGNLGVYAAGGIAITPKTFGLRKLNYLDIGQAAGTTFEWDQANSKIKAYQQGAGAGAFTEVGAIDITARTFQFEARGL
jgi:hypothetical protein